MDSFRVVDEAPKDDDDDDESETSFPELLNFACRVQTLISELLLLSGRIPPEFLDRRYDPVLFDLRYFDSPNDFEAKINGNVGLENLEDQLRESCSGFMQRFFLLANGIVVYHQELLKYLNDLQERVHYQTTLENENGRQLLTESLALFGFLLLLMEHQMRGSLREKLLVAHLRHDRCFDAPNLEAMSLLCRVRPSTMTIPLHQVKSSHSTSMMTWVQKPEDLLIRFPFPKKVVDSVISCLRDCDLYNQIRHYPDPNHRYVALASQAGYLYVLLFYSPEILHNGYVMREIVDRFFKDSLVVPISMQFIVDLSSSWDAYTGAKASVSSCLSPSFMRDLCQAHYLKVKDLMCELQLVLSNNVLTRDYVLNNSHTLLSSVRNCNVSLRWLLLHRSCNDKKLRDIVTSTGISHQIEEGTLVSLLLKTSQVEFNMKSIYTELLESKGTLWQESKGHASKSMQELSEYYSGFRELSSKMKDEDLMDLFKKLSAQVCSLDYANSGNAGKKLSHMISTVKEIEQRYENKEDLQIKHHFPVIRKYLQSMLQALSLHHDTLLTFSVITEAVYMWGFIGKFTDKLWKKIEEDSSIVLNLPSLFLKFRSMLNAPLLRLSQNGSSDLPFVSAYFSAQYVSHICAILEIIPAMLCRILNDDVIHTLQPFHPPKRIERDNLQSFIKPEPHFHLTKAFNQICIFSQGVMAMRRTLLGQIDLDVKKWIEVKIRKEISKLFEDKLKSFFLYPSVGLEELEMNLQTLTSYLLSQFCRMECFQDLIDLQGTRVWEEEFTCFLKRCAQKECDDFASQRNQESIVMPLQVNFSNPQTFLGHIMFHILKLTMPSRSMYIEPMSGWFDAEGRELLGLRFFELLESCVGPVGMASLDSLLAFIIQKNLEQALRGLKNLIGARCLEQLQLLDDALGPSTSLPLLGWSTYQQMAIFADTLWEPWVESLACTGQLQLIRCLIASKLKSACKVKAGSLFASLDGMIASVSIQTEKSFKGCKKEDRGTKELLLELSKQGQLCGFSSPLHTVYISEDPPAFLGRCASVVTISQLPRYVLHSHLGTLTSHLKKVSLDFSPVVIGLGTFLRQFNPVHLIQYVQYMGQYIRVTAEACGAMQETRKGNTDPTSEVLKSIFWFMYFCKHMGIQKDLIDSCLPLSLLAVLQA